MNSQLAIANFHQDRTSWEASLAENANSPDSLEMWFNYISWYEQNQSHDPESKFRQTLERCLSTFEYNETYKQDLRMVKLWMKYIDMQSNPLHLYQLLYQRKIGTQCSAFYIGWAHYYDSANALKQAESIYNLGFQVKAQPIEEIQAAHTKFRMSISQRMLYDDNLSKKRAASNLIDQRNNITSLNPQQPAGKRQKVESEHSTSNGNNEVYNNSQYVTDGGSQCDLNNSADVIASSLNSVYDTDTDGYSQLDELSTTENGAEVPEGIKLFPNFCRSAKNNNEVWEIALCLEEPYDPDRRCYYPKQSVYPGNDQEFSLDEIRARRWDRKRQEIVYQYKIQQQRKQLELQQKQCAELQAKQIQYQQQLQERQRLAQLQQQQQQNNQMVQPTNSYYQNYNNYPPDSEYYYQNHGQNSDYPVYNQDGEYRDPAQADVGQYCNQNTYQQQQQYQQQPTQYQQNSDQFQRYQAQPAQSSVLPIPNSSNRTQTYLDTVNGGEPSQNHAQPLYQQSTTPSTSYLPVTSAGQPAKTSDELDDFEEQIEASTIRFFPTNNANKSKTITIKFKKDKPGKVPSSESSSPVPTKKRKSKKAVETLATVNEASSSGSNSVDTRYYTNLNNYNYSDQSRSIDDANLLLSIGNVQGDETLQARKKNISQFYDNEDSFSHSDFKGIYYGGENSNSTPVKMPRLLAGNKTSTPISQNFKYLKSKASHLSNQNDDSMCSTGEPNSYFAAESDEEVKQRRIDNAKETIEKHMGKTLLDPFSSELCMAFLKKLEFPPRNNSDICHVINTTVVTKLMQTKVALLGNQTYHIEKEVGRGAYGAVYRAVSAYTGEVVAVKVQKPPNSWELYICSEVKKRISNPDILPGFMGISSAVLARNASILISEFSQYGSLLDINNRIRQATTKVMHESLVMHFTSQILSIIDHLHLCKIVHADIKPDNFLLMKIPTPDSHVPTIRLIDFGCAIDMTLFPEKTQFKKVIQTDGFTCVEMQEGRPWSYQTDLFCVSGTVHVMLFGEYMQLLKKFGAWDIKQKLPRYLKKTIWTEVFTKLLNIKDLQHLPDLKHLKSIIDDELYNMESELQKQIRTLSNILHKR